MQFPGVLRNSTSKIQGVIEKPVEISRSREICVEQGFCFLVLEFQRCDVT